MSINIKPLEDRIVVQALDAEETTASGLVLSLIHISEPTRPY